MKTKLLLFDLSICSLWMLSLLGGRDGWYYPVIAFAVLGVIRPYWELLKELPLYQNLIDKK